jgi:ribosome-associated protein
MSDGVFVTTTVILPESELSVRTTRASGPGGQNVNKVSTKVELCFDLPATRALDESAKARLRRTAKHRLDADGCLLVVCQDTRSRAQNLELARERLAALVRAALAPPKRRRATKPTRASKERRLDDKKRVGQRKRARAKVED